jgi:hypothetical protein
MVLLTKEIFIKLKELVNIHVNENIAEQWDTAGNLRQSKSWQVFIHGIIDGGSPHNDSFQTYITCETKEDAYRIFRDLAQQIIESGEVSEFQSKLFNDVVIEEKKEDKS